ncbi:NAD(P)-dependent dehydrogenase (short-subunit alcohol dehydrogenase family) [Bradyrhizobium sp. i1.4.4]
MNTDQKVVVVTGASRGLGEAIVKGYRSRNYRVVATSRSIAPSCDPDLLAIRGDVADPENRKARHRICFGAVRSCRQVDQQCRHLHPRAVRRIYRTELQGRARNQPERLLLHYPACHQGDARKKSGHVVQITTTLVEYANSNVSAVLASITKGGLAAATRGLAIEYASRGIRVNAVAPGMIKTPLRSPETHEALASLHPLKRMGEPEDIAQAILYLEDASFVTGETIRVDGGQIAGH